MRAQLILASSSIYRQQLLQRLTRDFISVSPAIDESQLTGETPAEMVERLSVNKARAVAQRYPNALIIGSDQVACHGQSVVGKPKDHAEAVQQLRTASGNTVLLHTGLALLNSSSGNLQTAVVPFAVTFRHLTDDVIEQYLLADQPYDCAGSVKCEELGIALLTKMRGDDPNALIGLPLIRLVDMLNNEQYHVFQ